MQNTERNSFADEAMYPCDFSSIMDVMPVEPVVWELPVEKPRKTFAETWLEQHPDVHFTAESVGRGLGTYLREQGVDVDAAVAELKERWKPVVVTPENTSSLGDPVSDLILHFNIFYEHVYLLEGYPEEAQPKLSELKLLGKRVHNVLVSADGSLNHEHLARIEAANIDVTLEGGFIQVAREKAILRQRVVGML